MIMMDNDMDSKQKQQMLNDIDEVDGVKWSLGMNSLVGPTVPESMVPGDLKKIFKGDQYELAFVCSEYGSATDEVNAQLAEIDKIVKKYDNTAMVIGEAPLMKDLQDTTDADLVRVNVCLLYTSRENIIDIVLLMVFSVMVWIFAGTRKKIERKEGIIMVVVYLVYCAYIIAR